MLSVKWRYFCLGLYMLTQNVFTTDLTLRNDKKCKYIVVFLSK